MHRLSHFPCICSDRSSVSDINLPLLAFGKGRRVWWLLPVGLHWIRGLMVWDAAGCEGESEGKSQGERAMRPGVFVF